MNTCVTQLPTNIACYVEYIVQCLYHHSYVLISAYSAKYSTPVVTF